MCVQQPTSWGVHCPPNAGGGLLLARVPGEALEGGWAQGGVQPPGCAAGRLGQGAGGGSGGGVGHGSRVSAVSTASYLLNWQPAEKQLRGG